MKPCLSKTNISNTRHIGLLVPDSFNKAVFIQDLLSGKPVEGLEAYSGLSASLFSAAPMEELMEQEERLDEVKVALAKNRKLKSFSSGERRKEFLKYCLSQNPDFLILDNPFDHLDTASREFLTKRLEEVSNKIPLLQLVTRRSDLLPFVDHYRQLDKKRKLVEPLESSIPVEAVAMPQGLSQFKLSKGVPLVEFQGVSVSYGEKKILNNIHWQVGQGEFWQLIGPNGSGKSTLLDIITGENPKGYGQNLYLFGRKKGSGESIWEIKQRIGYFSPAMLDLFRTSTTAEEMVLAGFYDSIGLYQKPTSFQRKQALEYLKMAGLAEVGKKSFHELSVGQQHVILLLRAIIKQPPLLILDEPTEGMDDGNAALVINLINQLVLQKNITGIMVSHRPEKNLLPTSIYELCPSDQGSTGKISFHENLVHAT